MHVHGPMLVTMVSNALPSLAHDPPPDWGNCVPKRGLATPKFLGITKVGSCPLLV